MQLLYSHLFVSLYLVHSAQKTTVLIVIGTTFSTFTYNLECVPKMQMLFNRSNDFWRLVRGPTNLHLVCIVFDPTNG